MSKVIVESIYDQPLTAEILEEADARTLPCLEARDAHWCYSLLSTDRCRMICTFDAPDAESVRDAYRKAGGLFKQIWSAEILSPEGSAPDRDAACLKVIEGTYPPFTQDTWNAFHDKTLAYYAEFDIEWIRSFVSPDRRRVICEVNAPDTAAIRETYRKLEMPINRVWSAQVLTPQLSIF